MFILKTGAHAQAPSVSIRKLAGIEVAGVLGQKYQIQTRGDFSPLDQWSTLTELRLESPSYLYVDLDSSSLSARLYRAVVVTPGVNIEPVNPRPRYLVWIPDGTFLMGSPNNDLAVRLG